jgi:hypothetical protein
MWIDMTEKPLTLRLKGEHWLAIQAGSKPLEFRLVSKWAKQIEGKSFSEIRLWWGYPPKTDTTKLLIRKWQGAEKQVITHPEFGPEPVEVFAIDVTGVIT